VIHVPFGLFHPQAGDDGLHHARLGGSRPIQREKPWHRPVPQTDIPVITVSIVYPGASPEAVKQDVVKKIEEAVNPIEKVKEISSTQPGVRGHLDVQFHLGRDVDQALDDVRTRIGQIRRDLPSTMEEPVISKFDPSQLPVVIAGGGADGQHTGMGNRELTRIGAGFPQAPA